MATPGNTAQSGGDQQAEEAARKKLLKSIGKDDVLKYIREKVRYLSPYEMRQALDPEETGAMVEAHQARHVPAIEGIRNVLVVAPLTLTWFALAVAIAAYQQSVQLSPEKTQPTLLQLWQEGFPALKQAQVGGFTIPLTFNHAHIFTFAGVALADFSILLLLLLLTAWAQYRSVRAGQQGRAVQQWLERQLFVLSQESIAISITPAEEDKPRWASEVQEVVKRLNETLVSVSETVRGFEGALSKQGGAVQRMLDNTGDITRTVKELTTFYELVYNGSKEINDLLPRIEEHISHMTGDQQDTAQAWRDMVQQLGLAADSVSSIAAALGDPRLMDEAIRIREEIASRPYNQRPAERGLLARVKGALGSLFGS